jgi:hypothetical protein
MKYWLTLCAILLPMAAQAAPFSGFDGRYPWLRTAEVKGGPIRAQVPPPAGYSEVDADGWGTWLRGLPVQPADYPLHVEGGAVHRNQRTHFRVVQMDVLPWQQCADSILRLRAEYLRSIGVRFSFSGLSFDKGSRADFDRFLRRLFVFKGTVHMAGELTNPGDRRARPGDLFVIGGSPGHVVMVLDVVHNAAGNRQLLIGNGFMPAQEFHIVKTTGGGHWFDERNVATGMRIALGYTFDWRHHRRF